MTTGDDRVSRLTERVVNDIFARLKIEYPLYVGYPGEALLPLAQSEIDNMTNFELLEAIGAALEKIK